jgi:hypothetical protein
MTDASRHIFGEDIEPMRVERPSFADLPTDEYLVRLAQRAEWLMLQVPTVVTVVAGGEWQDPTEGERQRRVQVLTALLPEHQVWDSNFLPDERWLAAARRNGVDLDAEGTRIPGMSRFSVRRFVTGEAIEEHLGLLVAATGEYRALANALMRRLAAQLGVDVREFAAQHWRKLAPQKGGRLDDGRGEVWDYFFHGVDCAFTRAGTGVTVEARLGCGPLCGDDFGVLHPWFFLHFVNTAAATDRPEYLPLARALRDWDGNARRALEFMERRGLLRRVQSDSVIARGWVVAEGGDPTSEVGRAQETGGPPHP